MKNSNTMKKVMTLLKTRAFWFVVLTLAGSILTLLKAFGVDVYVPTDAEREQIITALLNNANGLILALSAVLGYTIPTGKEKE